MSQSTGEWLVLAFFTLSVCLDILAAEPVTWFRLMAVGNFLVAMAIVACVIDTE